MFQSSFCAEVSKLTLIDIIKQPNVSASILTGRIFDKNAQNEIFEFSLKSFMN